MQPLDGGIGRCPKLFERLIVSIQGKRAPCLRTQVPTGRSLIFFILFFCFRGVRLLSWESLNKVFGEFGSEK